MSELRPYQIEAVAAAEAHWASGAPLDPMLVMATGTGKTKTARALIAATLGQGGRVVVLAHREELLLQFAALFPGVAGIVQAGRNEPRKPMVCASVATLANRSRVDAILAAGPIGLIVVDEAHHTPSPTHTAAVAALRSPMTRLLGLTATADREDGADLGAIFEIVFSYGVVPAVAEGWLVPPYAAIARLPGFDMGAVAHLDDEAQGAALIKAHVVEHTVAAVLAAHAARRLPDPTDTLTCRAADLPLLVFTASVAQAELTATALSAAGIPARHVSGSTPRTDRARLLAAFSAGKVKALCNAGVLTEGTDLPRAGGIVLARAFQSWALFVQSVGRGLRLHHPDWRPADGLMNAHHPAYARTVGGGKRTAFILDLAGATEKHSLVAAPVLIGSAPCEHEWRRDEHPSPGATCGLCSARVACAALAGPHTYGDEGTCTACATPQCAASPIRRHLWTPLDDGTRSECCFCGATSNDPLAGLCGRKSTGPAPAVPRDAWLEIDPATWALSIGDHGLLFVAVADPHPVSTRDLFWLPKGARKARPIGRRCSRSECAALTADIVRKAERFTDKGPVRPGTAAYAIASRAASVIADAASEGDARRALRTAAARERWAAVRPPATASEVAA